MTTLRDARYRQSAQREHERAEGYRDVLLAIVVPRAAGRRPDRHRLGRLDQAADDLAEVARRREDRPEWP